MGAKARMALAVAPSSGMAVCPTISLAASRAGVPVLHAHAHAVGHHDGIVHQHAQGDDEAPREMRSRMILSPP
jgi:hypothetical protein